MPFHVPFNQRHPVHQQGPIYIGFDVPAPRPRHKFNWWGFHAMWMSLTSLMTAGFLSPIALLVSLVGLRRPGKKMATLGLLTSLAGIALATAITVGAASAHHHHVQQKVAQTIKKQVVETKSLIAAATKELVEFRNSHAGVLPNEIDANMLVIKHVDAWGESLRFDAEVDHGVIRSAGPDRKFDTRDDVSKAVKGKTDRKRLLPVVDVAE